MTLSLTLVAPFIIALLILLEGLSRVFQFPKPNIMAGIWLVVGIILFILAIIGANAIHIG